MVLGWGPERGLSREDNFSAAGLGKEGVREGKKQTQCLLVVSLPAPYVRDTITAN